MTKLQIISHLSDAAFLAIYIVMFAFITNNIWWGIAGGIGLNQLAESKAKWKYEAFKM